MTVVNLFVFFRKDFDRDDKKNARFSNYEQLKTTCDGYGVINMSSQFQSN